MVQSPYSVGNMLLGNIRSLFGRQPTTPQTPQVSQTYGPFRPGSGGVQEPARPIGVGLGQAMGTYSNLFTPQSAFQQPAVPSVSTSQPSQPTTDLSSFYGGSSFMSPAAPSAQTGTTPNPPAQMNTAGFQSTDPTVLDRIRQMQQQTINRSSLAVPQTSTGETINPETGGVTGIPSTNQLLADIAKYSQLSEEEIKAAEELSTLGESYRLGFMGEGERAIPLNFITGRQKTLEERALSLSTPIAERAALAQARRTGQLSAAQNLLSAQAPTAVGENTTLVNPLTGEIIRRGTSSADQQAQTTFYNLAQQYPDGAIQYDPSISAQENLFRLQQSVSRSPTFLGAGTETSEGDLTENQILTQAQDLVEGGFYSDLNSAIGAISSGDFSGAQKAGAESEVQRSESMLILGDKLDLINSIANSVALDSVTGVTGLGRISNPFQLSAESTLTSNIERLISQETLDTLVSLKDRGGTLGALSDSELHMLRSAATSINSWMIKDDSGNWTGKLKVGQEDFLNEVNRIQELTIKALNRAAGTDITTEELQTLQKQFPDKTTAEIIGELSLSNDLSMSENGSNVARIADAIGQFESGGNYQARGPVVTSGQYRGERALGKYQIMPGNLPSWSREALGREVSVQEFLDNPQIQDQIAQYKMNQIFNKYGTVEDVASVWFSGQPVARAGNRQDVLGTTVPTYIRNIVSIYNRLS